jgi:DNA gyrase subunit B
MRDLEMEMDQMKLEMIQLQKLVQLHLSASSHAAYVTTEPCSQSAQNAKNVQNAQNAQNVQNDHNEQKAHNEGYIYYSGQYHNEKIKYKWDAQEQPISSLLNLDGEKMARILSALGNKQRLDILKTVIKGPTAGAELVEQLNMGTTGQLYHHTKALIGSDLLVQEERGGSYSLPSHRVLPVLLLLAAVSELTDTSAYMDMAEARDQANLYLGTAQQAYDPHVLVWALLENSILEHREGNCKEIHLFMHNDRYITVADNGRGIPITALSNKERPTLQTVLTEIGKASLSTPYYAAGAEKGISVAVVNALSYRLGVEIRREGTIYRQDYKHGIPQSEVTSMGVTQETGTSITLEPDADLFKTGFILQVLQKRASEIKEAYPKLDIHIHS